MAFTQEIRSAIARLLEAGREVEAQRLRGRVRVVTTDAIEALLKSATAAGGDGERTSALEAQVAELETRCEMAESEARRRTEQIGLLETQLESVRDGNLPTRAETATRAEGARGASAVDAGYLDLVEQPDYAAILAEVNEAREDLARVAARFQQGPAVHELATAIMKALGDDEEAPQSAPASPAVAVLRTRLEEITEAAERDRSALGILFEAMLDGNGSVGLLTELVGLVAQGQGYVHEVRTLRRALGLVAEIPVAA